MRTQRVDLQVELQLWDTAGQERFHSLGPIYYRDAAAALIVFDITDMDSFERAKAWVKELQQMVIALRITGQVCFRVSALSWCRIKRLCCRGCFEEDLVQENFCLR